MLKNHLWVIIMASACTLIACGGGGGASTDAPATTQALRAVSYNNFKNVGLTPQDLPTDRSGPGTVRAYGDFSGTGRLDLFAATLTYWPPTTPEDATPSTFEFWRKQSDGSFIQDTLLLSNPSAACIHPRKAIVADFNGDGRSDIFVACHGYDASPYPGEKNKVILSQANGSYVVQDASSEVGFFHSASAADFDGDGDIDVIVANAHDTIPAYVLLNQGQGSFVRESGSRLPSTITGPKNYFTVEVMDVDGDEKADLVLGGHEWESAPTLVLINPGSNNFTQVTPVTLPAVTNEGVVLDFVATGAGANRTLWVLRTSGGDGTFYLSRTLQKINWQTLTSTLALSERPGQWFPWILPAVVSGQAVIVPDANGLGVSVPQ